MGRAAHCLERTYCPVEQEPRPARGKDSQFCRRGFAETGSGTHVSLRKAARRNCAAHDLACRADRYGAEHAAVAVTARSVPERPTGASLVPGNFLADPPL